MHFIKELIIHKEKTKDCLMGVLYTQLKFKSNILHQNNPKSKYYCKKWGEGTIWEILKPFKKLAVMYKVKIKLNHWVMWKT